MNVLITKKISLFKVLTALVESTGSLSLAVIAPVMGILDLLSQ